MADNFEFDSGRYLEGVARCLGIPPRAFVPPPERVGCSPVRVKHFPFDVTEMDPEELEKFEREVVEELDRVSTTLPAPVDLDYVKDFQAGEWHGYGEAPPPEFQVDHPVVKAGEPAGPVGEAVGRPALYSVVEKIHIPAGTTLVVNDRPDLFTTKEDGDWQDPSAWESAVVWTRAGEPVIVEAKDS